MRDPLKEPSSYLQYLPPVLWSAEHDTEQLLGKMLKVFEKLLTGIEDGVPIGASGREYPPLKQVVDDIPKLFNPWTTGRARSSEASRLWLASWLGLELDGSWSEYQQRQLIEQIVSIYRLRGLEAGMHTYLDIFAQTPARPRIAIDDGTAVIRARFRGDGTAVLQTVAHSQAVTFPASPDHEFRAHPVLIHPVSLAVDSMNHYFVLDQGVDESSDIKALRQPALWRISTSGEVPYAVNGSLPVPVPVHSAPLLRTATAVLVDAQDRCSVISVGEISSVNSRESRLHRFAPPDYTPVVLLDQSTTPQLPAIHPVDMVFDGEGAYVILDRGAHLLGDPPTDWPAEPRIVVVRETGDRIQVESHPLEGVAEPTAIGLEPGGSFIVADAGDQFGDGSLNTPATLVRVDPADGWSSTPLLSKLPDGDNPLVFPTAMVLERPGTLLVCDSGLRWGIERGEQSFPSNRSMAEAAAVYRVEFGANPPVISAVTHQRTLVHPADMVFDRRGDLLIVDRGDSLRRSTKRNWRARANEFGVVVHFSRQRPTTHDERNRVRDGIRRVLEEQKPSHVTAWLKSE